MEPDVRIFRGDVEDDDVPASGPAAKRTEPSPETQGFSGAVRTQIEELVAKIRGGDPTQVARLRQLLVENPEIWNFMGDLSALAEFSWMGLIAKQEPMVIESIKLSLAHMKEDLLGDRPTRLERMLVDQIVVTWLELKAIEVTATSDHSPQRNRHAESAQKRYLESVKTLTSLRALLPAGMEPLDASYGRRRAR